MSYGDTARKLGMQGETVRKMAKVIARKLPLECQHPAGPAATIRKYCDSLNTPGVVQGS
jgi:hypothetical protein